MTESPQQQIETALSDGPEIPNATIDVLGDIAGERKRQDDKWGSQRKHPDTLWYTILGEEVGEVGNAILESGSWKEPASQEWLDRIYEELIQVGAVAVCWAEAIKARGLWPTPAKTEIPLPIVEIPQPLVRCTIGTMRAYLKEIQSLGHANAEVRFGQRFYPKGTIYSYRGYYAQGCLPFDSDQTGVEVVNMIALMDHADGSVFQGWKGGDYVFDEDTPLWMANRGEASGLSIMGPPILDGSTVDFQLVNWDEGPEFRSFIDTLGKAIR